MKKRLREWRLDPEAYVRRRWRERVGAKTESYGPVDPDEAFKAARVTVKFATIAKAWAWLTGRRRD